MERAILSKLRESSAYTYKGYEIKEDRDGNFIVYNMKGVLGMFESFDDARAYIDDQTHSSGTVKRSSLKYCVRISYPRVIGWHYLCKDGHYKHERYVTKSIVKLFDTENKAKLALKYSTRAIDYQSSETPLYRY